MYFFVGAGSCEGGRVSVCGLSVWGILCVWCDFMVCVLCEGPACGDSSSSILYGTWLSREGFPVGSLCFFYLLDFS